MSKSIRHKVSIIILASLLFQCANDESSVPEIVITPEFIVSQYEVSEIIYDGDLDSEQFDATFGNEAITVYKSSENTISFMPLLEPGVYELNIPKLTYSVYVSVIETVLTETPDEIINELESTIFSFIADLTDDDVDKEILLSLNSSFSEMLENATDMEKKQLALYYQANQKVFDAILKPNFDNVGGRVTGCVYCTEANLKFGTSLLAFSAGVYTAVTSLANPPLAAVGALVAVVAWKTSKKLLAEITDARLKVIGSTIDGVLSSGRLESTSLEFVSDQSQVFAFETNNRTLVADDRSSETEGFITFFDSYDNFSEIIDRLNGVINFVNDKVFFVNFDNVSVTNISDTPSEETYEVESDFFSNYRFSVAHEQISVTANLVETGQLELIITGDQALLDLAISVDTQLIIEYTDEFNSSTQSIDIALIIESHTLEVYSGDNQAGCINETLENPIKVLIKDQDGNPVANYAVSFSVTEGSVSTGEVRTNANGIASTMWALGSTVGEQLLEVTAYENDGVTSVQGSPLTITAQSVEPTFNYQGTWLMYLYHYNSGNLQGIIRIIFDESGFAEFYDIDPLDGSGYVIFEQSVTMNYNPNILTITFNAQGSKVKFAVLSLDDTSFEGIGTFGDSTTVLERQ